MAVTLEELFMSSPRREIKSSNKNTKKKVVRNTSLLETLTKNGGITSRIAEDGTMKMKILVKKQDLKQMLEAMNVVSSNNDNNDTTTTGDNNKSPSPATLSSIERRLYDLMKRKRASQGRRQQQEQQRQSISSSWRPALQSIPEEYC